MRAQTSLSDFPLDGAAHGAARARCEDPELLDQFQAPVR